MLIEVPIQTIKSDCPMIFFNDRPIFDLTEDRQLGLKKTGCEIGIHSARHLARDSRIAGWVILINDFEKAFNRVDRALLLELVVALVPEAASVFWVLYAKETLLVTDRGDEVKCSTGVLCKAAPFHLLHLHLW